MITCSVQSYYRYSGLSTDKKPTKNIQDASIFWELDTGREYEWRENGWYLLPADFDYAYVLDDYSQENIVYKGWAKPGAPHGEAVWKIQKVDMTVGIKKTWALGSADFIHKWIDRLSLEYL